MCAVCAESSQITESNWIRYYVLNRIVNYESNLSREYESAYKWRVKCLKFWSNQIVKSSKIR